MTHYSVISKKEKLGNIGNVCKGKRNSAYGYKWIYKKDYKCGY